MEVSLAWFTNSCFGLNLFWFPLSPLPNTMDQDMDSILPAELEGDGRELMEEDNAAPQLPKQAPAATNMRHLKREKAWALRSVLKGEPVWGLEPGIWCGEG